MMHEALRMGGVGRLQHRRPLLLDVCSMAMMDRGWRVVADPAVAMLVAVPLEERLAERTRLLNAGEPVWERGAVLQCFELRLRIRIVIRDVRP